MADRPARTWPALDLDRRPGTSLDPGFDDRLAMAIDGLGVIAVESEAGAHWRLHFDATATRDAAAVALGPALRSTARSSQPGEPPLKKWPTTSVIDTTTTLMYSVHTNPKGNQPS